VAKAARELQQASGKTVRSAEWSEDDGVLWFRGKIYVPWNAVMPLENFWWKCNMGYTLYPWISLLESTLETSYKPQT